MFNSGVPTRRRYKNGRPTKRTKAVLTPLFEAIRIGVPYKLACMAAGISYECFNKWRQNDPAFDAEVEQAAAEPAVKMQATYKQTPDLLTVMLKGPGFRRTDAMPINNQPETKEGS